MFMYCTLLSDTGGDDDVDDGKHLCISVSVKLGKIVSHDASGV